MFRFIPLFGVLLVIYNLLLVTGDANATLQSVLFETSLLSGATWSFNVHHLFMSLGVVALYLEILKATYTGMASVLDHSLSTLVFVAFVIEFLIMPGCGTSTFFLLALMALLDVIAGFTVTIVAARRDFAVGGVER